MAVIKNGKTRGRIGKFVYRVVDGVEIVQPYTRNVQQTENTKRASAKFAKSSKMGSEVYQQIKTFASDFTNVKTYREIVSLFRGSIFLHDEQSKLEEINSTEQIIADDKPGSDAGTLDNSDWTFIEESDFLTINKEAALSDFLKDAPLARFSETECTIQIPEFKPNNQAGKHPKGSNYVEFFASVYHTHSDGTYPLCNFSSGRLVVTDVFPAQSVILPLEWQDNVEVKGVVIICFGVSFYAEKDSRMHVNNSRFNPSVILGLWYK